MISKRVKTKLQARPKASPKFNEQLVTWLYQVHHDPEFTPSALAVLLEIAWPMGSIGQCSWPSFETIARNCNLSKSTIVDLIQKLVARGHLLAEGGSAGRGNSKRYRINIIGAATEPTTLKGFVANVLDADPMPLNGTLTDLLEPGTGSIKGTLADLNKERKKVSKKERKQEAALQAAASIDRFPTEPRDVTDAAPSDLLTTDIAAASMPETKRDSADAGRLIGSEISERITETPRSDDSRFFARRAVEQIGADQPSANLQKVHRNGHALCRPDNQRRQPEGDLNAQAADRISNGFVRQGQNVLPEGQARRRSGKRIQRV